MSHARATRARTATPAPARPAGSSLGRLRAATRRWAPRWALTIAIAVAVLATRQVEAQVPGAMTHEPAGPQLVVNGRGEVKVTPDRALLSLTVETRRPLASAASQENARLQRLVFDTLRLVGILPADVSTADYSVQPEQRWNQQKQQSELIGYVVRNTIRVRIQNVDLVGKIIDASLAKGSNLVTALEFYASNVEVARRQALTQAIEQARADADLMAKAAGGTVAGLLELTSIENEPMPVQPMRVMSMAARPGDAVETPIATGAQALVVRVATRWRFAPTPR